MATASLAATTAPGAFSAGGYVKVSPSIPTGGGGVVVHGGPVSAKLNSSLIELSTPAFKCGTPVVRRRRGSSGHFSILARAGSPESTTTVEVQETRNDGLGLPADVEKFASSSPRTDLTLFSPSKINVFLRVTNKRADGFHDLASLFHVISLGDVIEFSVSPGATKDSLTTNASGVPLDEKNLIIKALNLYRRKTGSETFFRIHLDKRVPTGAGLGGGSGNAATALWAANQLSGGLATEKELQDWSGEIGSDIPVFFSKGAAYCTGRGEVVRDIPSPFDLSTPMVLIKPPEECSTPEVFKTFRLSDCSSADPEELLDNVIKNGITQSVCINDLEAPAFQVLPTLRLLKDRISAASSGRYQALFMSGSGSTIVGVGDVEPPPFLHDEDQYSSVFISEAFFLTRREDEWYEHPGLTNQESAA